MTIQKEKHAVWFKKKRTSKRNKQCACAPASMGQSRFLSFPLPAAPAWTSHCQPSASQVCSNVCSGRSLATKRDRATTLEPSLGAGLCLKSMIRSSMLLVMPLPDNRVAAAERLATTQRCRFRLILAGESQQLILILG